MAFTVQINPFGEWLKTQRELQGLSMQELAEKAENICSASYIAQIETDYYFGEKGNPMQPDEIIVEKLAVALNQSVNEARKIAGYAALSEQSKDEINSELQIVLHKYNHLSAKSQQFAIRHFNGIIKFLLEMENIKVDDLKSVDFEQAQKDSDNLAGRVEKPEILPDEELKRRGIKPIKAAEVKKKAQ